VSEGTQQQEEEAGEVATETQEIASCYNVPKTGSPLGEDVHEKVWETLSSMLEEVSSLFVDRIRTDATTGLAIVHAVVARKDRVIPDRWLRPDIAKGEVIGDRRFPGLAEEPTEEWESWTPPTEDLRGRVDTLGNWAELFVDEGVAARELLAWARDAEAGPGERRLPEELHTPLLREVLEAGITMSVR
jgi:hypothetical protein